MSNNWIKAIWTIQIRFGVVWNRINKITYKDDLVTCWQKFYHREKQDSRDGGGIQAENFNWLYRWSKTEWLIATFSMLMGIRGLLSVFGPRWLLEDSNYQLYLATFYQILPTDPFRTEAMFFFWSANILSTMLIALILPRDHFKWIDTLDALESGRGNSIGLNSKQFFRLQRYSSRFYSILNSICRQTSFLIAVVCIQILFGLYNGLTSLMFLLSWVLLNTIYAKITVGIIVLLAPYILVLIKVLQLKLDPLIDALCNNLNPRWTTLRNLQTKQLLKSLAGILRELECYNHFWKHVISVSLLWKVLLINFYTYIVFLLSYNGLTVGYFVFWFNEHCFLLLILRNVTKIGTELTIGRKRIIQCLIIRPMPLTTRLKILNFVETMSSKRGTGFSFMNDIQIEPHHMVVIVREMTQLFFLIVQISNSPTSKTPH